MEEENLCLFTMRSLNQLCSVQLNLEPSERPFRLAFQGIIGENMVGIYSTFALDDVKLTPGACNTPASCTFDGDLCAWYIDEYRSTIDWQQATPGELSLVSRPYADHTLNTNKVK